MSKKSFVDMARDSARKPGEIMTVKEALAIINEPNALITDTPYGESPGNILYDAMVKTYQSIRDAQETRRRELADYMRPAEPRHKTATETMLEQQERRLRGSLEPYGPPQSLLTLAEVLKDFAARLSIGAGGFAGWKWRFAAESHWWSNPTPYGIAIYCEWPDRSGGGPPQAGRAFLSFDDDLARAPKVAREKLLVSRVRAEMMKLVEHELDESITLDGRRPLDPHRDMFVNSEAVVDEVAASGAEFLDMLGRPLLAEIGLDGRPLDYAVGVDTFKVPGHMVDAAQILAIPKMEPDRSRAGNKRRFEAFKEKMQRRARGW